MGDHAARMPHAHAPCPRHLGLVSQNAIQCPALRPKLPHPKARYSNYARMFCVQILDAHPFAPQQSQNTQSQSPAPVAIHANAPPPLAGQRQMAPPTPGPQPAASHIIANYATGGETRDITRVIATGSVTYIEGENTAKGDKLDYDLTSNLYVLTGENASVAGSKGTMTATKSITYDSTDNDNRKVTAIGKAHYKNSDGRNVFGDKLIAYIGADGTLKTIDAYDNTKVITAQGTVAIADKLNYIASTSMANLDGNVEIADKENIMRGARAEIDFDKEISKIISGPTGKRVTGILTP